jgi:hypothetical protein
MDESKRTTIRPNFSLELYARLHKHTSISELPPVLAVEPVTVPTDPAPRPEGCELAAHVEDLLEERPSFRPYPEGDRHDSW